jgi:hypothetical protein
VTSHIGDSSAMSRRARMVVTSNTDNNVSIATRFDDIRINLQGREQCCSAVMLLLTQPAQPARVTLKWES